MILVIVVVFVVGYTLIALEHSLNINKTASAILTGVICWTLFMLSEPGDLLVNSETYTEFLAIHHTAGVASDLEIYREFVLHELNEHLAAIAQILFFLMGAMTIVELIDAHRGFRFITDKIQTKNPVSLMWIVCIVTFFLSAILDNLTTSIVMVSLLRKLIGAREMRLLFAGMVVIAANAGGAWTPIGDVTTTMLWIGGQITTVNIMQSLFLPSVVCLLIPLSYLSFTLKGSLSDSAIRTVDEPLVKGSKLMLILGVGALVSVPIFKTVTHLPPFAGMLLGLGVLWVVSEVLHPEMDEIAKKNYTVAGALSRIDVPSVLFFLGILLAVGALESMQLLQAFAGFLDRSIGDQRIIITLIGVLSALVDNVPLVAASMGMYSLNDFPVDHMIWEYLAYCAGTGGSILIIGSAAGVAVMGIEKIDFIWYLKRISLLALIAYLAGASVYIVQDLIFGG